MIHKQRRNLNQQKNETSEYNMSDLEVDELWTKVKNVVETVTNSGLMNEEILYLMEDRRIYRN